jgi:hypothetical protein
MTSEQGVGIPAQVGRAFGPGRLDELVDVAQERAPAMRWHSGMRW